MEHPGVTSRKTGTDGFALFRRAGENPAPVVLHPLAPGPEPPARVDMPRPPAESRIGCPLPVLELVLLLELVDGGRHRPCYEGVDRLGWNGTE